MDACKRCGNPFHPMSVGCVYCTGQTTAPEGQKLDDGKRRWSLLPLGPVGQIVDVLTFGARKYAPDNWMKVANAKERYADALWRHLTAWAQGEKKDPESGFSHLAHVGCCLLFLMWFIEKEERACSSARSTD